MASIGVMLFRLLQSVFLHHVRSADNYYYVRSNERDSLLCRDARLKIVCFSCR